MRYYRLRYQQEFLIRDLTGPTLRQFTGLLECQARSINKLEFHTNMALSAVNVAKVKSGLTAVDSERKAFSMATVKTRYHNKLLLDRFIGILPEKAKLQINQAQLRQLCSFGCITP